MWSDGARLKNLIFGLYLVLLINVWTSYSNVLEPYHTVAGGISRKTSRKRKSLLCLENNVVDINTKINSKLCLENNDKDRTKVIR